MEKLKRALFVTGVFVAFLGMSTFESNMLLSSIATILGLAIANLGKWGKENEIWKTCGKSKRIWGF